MISVKELVIESAGTSNQVTNSEINGLDAHVTWTVYSVDYLRYHSTCSVKLFSGIKYNIIK